MSPDYDPDPPPIRASMNPLSATDCWEATHVADQGSDSQNPLPPDGLVTRLEQTKYLLNALRVLHESLDYETTLFSLVRLTVPAIADFAMVYEVEEPDTIRLAASMHVDPAKRELLASVREYYQTIPDNPASLLATAIRTCRPQMLSNVPTDLVRALTQDQRLIEIDRRLAPRSVLALPVVDEQELLCVLVLVMSDSGRAYNDSLLALGNELAGCAVSALANSQAYLELQQANSAKDQFLAVLSHELRTPLSPALAAVGTLQHALESSQSEPLESEILLDIIQRNIELEGRLIDDLLDLTRLGRGKLQISHDRVDLHTLIKSVLDVCRSGIAEKHLLLAVDLRAASPEVDGDPARLQQVVWNLLKNAIKFTPDGGTVSIRTRNKGNSVFLDVADNGIGMASELIPTIFDAFRQGARPVPGRDGGLGLGLSICRGIVELHGGAISVSSEGKDLGSTFTIELPAAAAQDDGDAGCRTEPYPATRFRILVVDPFHDPVGIVRLLLDNTCYKILATYTIKSALQHARELDFDILIAGLALPDGTGHDLLQRLQETGRLKRSIAIGKNERPLDISGPHFDRYITGPLSANALAGAIGILEL